MSVSSAHSSTCAPLMSVYALLGEGQSNTYCDLELKAVGISHKIEYVYDEAGRLLYEYTGPSQNRAYIWVDTTLVATVEDNATLHYVYTDHLGTPRAVTTTTSSTPIWAWPWLQNPFGEKPASGAGGYTFNLRYPGQYFEAETGLSYNYFRDYEPATGRYGQSDPLGLFSGQISTYSYAESNPMLYSDRKGEDVVVLEDSGSVYGTFGHIAVIIGNDQSGWTYFSKNSSAPSDSTAVGFRNFQDFERTDLSIRYNMAYRIPTTSADDEVMEMYGLAHYADQYRWYNNNCGDLVAKIARQGGVFVPQQIPITIPHELFVDIKYWNAGQEITW
jgi:RHS repeat-associated protein